MTQSGEQLTLKGEIIQEQDSVLSYHRAVAISHSINVKDGNKMEVTLFPPDQSAALYQMIFVIKGKIAFRKLESSEEYGAMESQQHNLCAIPQSTRMMVSSLQDEVICINLSREFLNRYLSNHPSWQQFICIQSQQALPMLADTNMHITPKIGSILQQLNQTTNSVFFDQLLLESKVIELLALQILAFEKLKNASIPLSLRKEEMEKMLSAREILINNGGKQLSLRSLAHLVGTNEFNLKRNFKIAFGSTVYNYLNHYKMEQARTMLQEKDVIIAEVAEKLGYKYATHFSSAFKKYYGYLPNTVKSGKLSMMFVLEDIFMALENCQALLPGL